jgi:hypothetical protein
MIMNKPALLQIALTTAAVFWMAAPAHANGTPGAVCPSGSVAQRTNANATLHCVKEDRIVRESVCSAVTVSSKSGSIGANVNVVQQVRRGAQDGCTSPLGQTSGLAQALLMPGERISDFTREEKSDGRDIWVKTVKTFVFPTLTVAANSSMLVGNTRVPINPTHNPANGVSCQSGFKGESRSNGINCVKETRQASSCDLGWTLRVDDLGRKEDKCIGINGAGHTVPQGVTNAQLQLQKTQWDLTVQSGRDQWVFSAYAYPVSR